MNTYKEVYKFLDPILKKNPQILYPELKKSHPEIAKKITYWSFNARKNKLFLKKQRGKLEEVSPVKLTVTEAVRRIRPTSPNFQEYVKVGNILLADPNAIHSHLKKARKIKMSDANYYQFRKRFCKLMGLNLTSRSSGATRENIVPLRRRPQLYTVLYEKEVNGFNDSAKALLTDFIESLNKEKIMGTLEVIETVRPNKTIEVRSYK